MQSALFCPSANFKIVSVFGLACLFCSSFYQYVQLWFSLYEKNLFGVRSDTAWICGSLYLHDPELVDPYLISVFFLLVFHHIILFSHMSGDFCCMTDIWKSVQMVWGLAWDAVLGGRNLVGSAWVLCLTSEQVNVGHHGSRGAVRTKNGSWVAAQKMVKSEDGQGASVAGVGKEGRRTHNASLFTRVSSVDLRSWMEADDLLR